MIRPESVNPIDRRYQEAGWTYFLLGSLILGLTVIDPALAAPERRTDIVHLLVGLPFFALFAYLIGRGERPVSGLLRIVGTAPGKARRIGRVARRILAIVLSISATGRAGVFLANALGHRPRVGFSPPAFELTSTVATPKMFINAGLMAIILALLVRAWWSDLRTSEAT